MIEHIVLVKFSPNTLKEHIDEVIRRTKALRGVIPGLIDLQEGHNFSARSQGYELGLTVRFTNIESLDQYQVHPKHKEIRKYMNEIGLLDIIVVDFEID
ncbi:Dabb family protein [Brevibacillus choshinensis]|uniref:Dabb family protein n=1 Tax=Brevibacillus choshinensis TaxID=54911 RepID=A0ABX7FX04_BRECH|nr:Dabb family protein [Brevibacillus choshinensis]QRG70324.1 Dabb family protein [Brevibacillus choshinensis]